MKVKELVEKLNELPQDEEIYFYDREWGPDDEVVLKKEIIYRNSERLDVWTITNN